MKVFIDRYQKTIRQVEGLTLELALQYVLPALRPGPFKDSICRRPPKTMEELRERVADEIRVENMKQGDKKAASEAKMEKDGRRPENQTGRHKIGGPREAIRLPQFQQYTPLNATREKILQEALTTELIPIPKRRPTPPGADTNKHCLYHKNMGHSTEECITLRDKIEELIRAGHLKKYVKSERAQTARHRERSPHGSLTQEQSGYDDRYYRAPRRPERHHRPSPMRRDRSHSRSRRPNDDRPVRGIINTISEGFSGGGSTSSARKRHLRTLRSVNNVQKRQSMPPITFTDDDFHAPDPDQDDPMVITAEIARYEISKVLIDQGSSVNILYWKTFQQMDISEDLIVPFHEQIVGFAGLRVDTRGYIDLWTYLGTGRSGDERTVRYLLVEANTSYNVLLGRPCLNAFRAIVPTPI